MIPDVIDISGFSASSSSWLVGYRTLQVLWLKRCASTSNVFGGGGSVGCDGSVMMKLGYSCSLAYGAVELGGVARFLERMSGTVT